MNKQKNGKALHLEHAAEEICFESLTVKDQEKLQEFGINPSSKHTQPPDQHPQTARRY